MEEAIRFMEYLINQRYDEMARLQADADHLEQMLRSLKKEQMWADHGRVSVDIAMGKYDEPGTQLV